MSACGPSVCRTLSQVSIANSVSRQSDRQLMGMLSCRYTTPTLQFARVNVALAKEVADRHDINIDQWAAPSELPVIMAFRRVSVVGVRVIRSFDELSLWSALLGGCGGQKAATT